MSTSLDSPINCAFVAQDLLGECPYWHPARGTLSRIDIRQGVLIDADPVTGAQQHHHLGAPLGFAVPRRAGGFIAGIGLTVKLLDAELTAVPLLNISPEFPANRLNDAICDSSGRLWAGTMSTSNPRERGRAALYRIDPDGTYEEVLGGLHLSNGMDWLDSGHTLLHVDSDAHRIDRYEVDVPAGRLGARHTLVQLDPSDGLPDGMTVDSENGIWLAFFEGGQVRRYDANGREQLRVALPVTCPTSVAFGGSDLRELYITTSRHRLTPEQAVVQQLAGSVLSVRTDVPGRPQHAFAG